MCNLETLRYKLDEALDHCVHSGSKVVIQNKHIKHPIGILTNVEYESNKVILEYEPI